ncbi:hypothetical protein G3I15_22515 [Streptomyces sp. SID10244]|nr:hypothetical protein [Streptomyces sp. SID10244]
MSMREFVLRRHSLRNHDESLHNAVSPYPDKERTSPISYSVTEADRIAAP